MIAQAAHPCWSCKGPVPAGAPFCSTCEAVQPPGQVDHFARLSVEARYELDLAELDRRYFALQRRLHPDRFATRTPRERALSQQQATSLNEAYETLKDPLRRADYLVHLKGAGVLPEGCDLIADPVVLMEAMEMRERLGETESPAEVDAIADETSRDMRNCVDELRSAFAANELATACRLTTRLKYLTKLAGEVKARRARLAAS
ncbi:MAG: Fe-S protein assembly co-chaperone HscB [Magnetospirillum sp. WYHS-4]